MTQSWLARQLLISHVLSACCSQQAGNWAVLQWIYSCNLPGKLSAMLFRARTLKQRARALGSLGPLYDDILSPHSKTETELARAVLWILWGRPLCNVISSPHSKTESPCSEFFETDRFAMLFWACTRVLKQRARGLNSLKPLCSRSAMLFRAYTLKQRARAPNSLRPTALQCFKKGFRWIFRMQEFLKF